MKVTVEDISTVKKKLHIQVMPDAIALEMKKAVADVAKKAKIPGFRPGKVPLSIIRQRFFNKS
jgi:trigger factor